MESVWFHGKSSSMRRTGSPTIRCAASGTSPLERGNCSRQPVRSTRLTHLNCIHKFDSWTHLSTRFSSNPYGAARAEPMDIFQLEQNVN